MSLRCALHHASLPLQGAARKPKAKKASKPAGRTPHPIPEAEKLLNEPKGDFMAMVARYDCFRKEFPEEAPKKKTVLGKVTLWGEKVAQGRGRTGGGGWRLEEGFPLTALSGQWGDGQRQRRKGTGGRRPLSSEEAAMVPLPTLSATFCPLCATRPSANTCWAARVPAQLEAVGFVWDGTTEGKKANDKLHAVAWDAKFAALVACAPPPSAPLLSHTPVLSPSAVPPHPPLVVHSAASGCHRGRFKEREGRFPEKREDEVLYIWMIM